MKMKLFFLFLVLTTINYSLKSQNSTHSLEMKMYQLQIDGISGIEQAKYIQNLISKSNRVLIAIVKPDGETRIACDQEITLNEIIEKLQNLTHLSYQNFENIQYLEMDYLIMYYEFGKLPTNNISTNSPKVVLMKDIQKQEKAFRIANGIWEKVYINKVDKLD